VLGGAGRPRDLTSPLLCLQGAVAATATPLVGVIASRWFGLSGTLADAGAADPRRAVALASALLVCCVVPWSACFVAYFALYRIYPADRRRAWPHSASVGDLAGLADAADGQGGGQGRPRGRATELVVRRGR
jgi:hypothetical protein